MGTRFELIVVDADADRRVWRSIGETALEPIVDWHTRLNRFDAGSVVSCLNRCVDDALVDDEMQWLLDRCGALSVASGGAFDIRFDGGLDFGGVGKGLAIDLAIERLRELGVTSAIVHGGTSTVATVGAQPDGRGFVVALGPGDGAPRVELRDESLSVSRHDGRGADHAGHVIDPATGKPAERALICAAVRGASAFACDAWSTATLVRGEGRTAAANGHDVWCEDARGAWERFERGGERPLTALECA